ncbi:MAG: response regulator [Candidatus Nitricoxidivorans perseverans]|uniref:Response regulator n=1 Tax=Candidatus Nitricoxidivorans perseverans TaxID=2975601 RepID=A0AA49FLK9_9PROT|nr:MAG: response regulator [Candidatus Nitricoxidivorans perseverans]
MSEPEQPKLTLLFVDDEASILSSLRRLFRQHGYNILTAESGAQGLEVLEKETVDLVVSDMRMPEMDGAKFLEEVRLRWPHVVRILLTGYADVTSTIAAINRGEIYRYIAKPWDDNDIVLTVREALEHKRLESENLRLLALTQRQNEELKELNASLEQKVAERTAELRQTLASLDQAHKELKKGFMATVRIFSGLIELRGGKLAGHSRRVAEHARDLARALGLDEAEQQDVFLAALLHDIGKISLPDALLERPFTALSPQEKVDFMRHPVRGQQVLMGVEQLMGAGRLIRHHHESMDGSGYPDRLAGLAIPMGARILAVANDYDALQMGTLILQALGPSQALEFIVRNRGHRYDPRVVDAFKDILREDISGMPERGAGASVLRSAAEEDSLIARRRFRSVPMTSDRLKEGMVLSRDLMHHEGYLLLSQGHRLDESLIKQLKEIEVIGERPLTVHIRIEERS